PPQPHPFLSTLALHYFSTPTSTTPPPELEKAPSPTPKSPADFRDLTAKFDEDPDLIDWGPDGIYFAATQKTTGHLFRLNPQTAQITRITAPDVFYFAGVSFTKDFKTLAIAADDATHMVELFISPAENFSPRKLTN